MLPNVLLIHSFCCYKHRNGLRVTQVSGVRIKLVLTRGNKVIGPGLAGSSTAAQNRAIALFQGLLSVGASPPTPGCEPAQEEQSDFPAVVSRAGREVHAAPYQEWRRGGALFADSSRWMKAFRRHNSLQSFYLMYMSRPHRRSI